MNKKARLHQVLSATLFLLAYCSNSGAHVRMIYWLDAGNNRIMRAFQGGSGSEAVVTSGLNEPVRLAIDNAAGKMYWVDQADIKVMSADLDGSNVQELVPGLSPLAVLSGIDLDPVENKIYWSDDGNGKIQRSNTDGSDVEDIPLSPTSVFAIAIEAVGRKLYWTEGEQGRILRADLNGSNVDTLVTGLGAIDGIALDVPSGRMYWSNYSLDRIQRANLDGTAVEDIVTSIPIPEGIALDLANGWIYWTDLSTRRVQRSTLDGQNVVTVVPASGGAVPRDVDLAEIPVSEASNEPALDSTFHLDQSFPNPMYEGTTILFQLGSGPGSNARIEVFDTRGRLVREFRAYGLEGGQGRLVWDGRDQEGRHVPSGIYSYRLIVDGRSLTRRLVVIR